MIINGIYKYFEFSKLGILMISIPILGILLTTIYMFRVVKDCIFTLNSNLNEFFDMDNYEIIICFILCILILFIGIYPNFIQSILFDSYKG